MKAHVIALDSKNSQSLGSQWKSGVSLRTPKAPCQSQECPGKANGIWGQPLDPKSALSIPGIPRECQRNLASSSGPQKPYQYISIPGGCPMVFVGFPMVFVGVPIPCKNCSSEHSCSTPTPLPAKRKLLQPVRTSG